MEGEPARRLAPIGNRLAPSGVRFEYAALRHLWKGKQPGRCRPFEAGWCRKAWASSAPPFRHRMESDPARAPDPTRNRWAPSRVWASSAPAFRHYGVRKQVGACHGLLNQWDLHGSGFRVSATPPPFRSYPDLAKCERCCGPGWRTRGWGHRNCPVSTEANALPWYGRDRRFKSGTGLQFGRGKPVALARRL